MHCTISQLAKAKLKKLYDANPAAKADIDEVCAILDSFCAEIDVLEKEVEVMYADMIKIGMSA